MRCGWYGTIKAFLELKMEDFIDNLTEFVYTSRGEAVNESQVRAWTDCFLKLTEVFEGFSKNTDFLSRAELIFEYEILLGGGRRPDVLLLFCNELLVIECKSYNEVSEAEKTQTSNYVRDIQLYHSVVQEQDNNTKIKVRGTLFLTSSTSTDIEKDEISQIYISSPLSLINLITLVQKLAETESMISCSAKKFLDGEYQPSPSLLEAAKKHFENEPLPKIKAVNSSNVRQALEAVKEIIEQSKRDQQHSLIFITGEPGSGKTLIGLQIAHENVNEAFYLSGNGPLIAVLQNLLGNDTAVKSLHSFKKEYENKESPRNIIIFDEAQRAWDAEKMKSNQSEPEVIVEIMTKSDWSVTIALIGHGQAIYTGEEGGAVLWVQAILNSKKPIQVYTPEELKTQKYAHKTNPNLYLNSSLRTHSAGAYHEFVNLLLNNDRNKAKESLQESIVDRHSIVITQDLVSAKKYLAQVFENTDKSYGLVISSQVKIKSIEALPFASGSGPNPTVCYFNDPKSDYYSNKLAFAATEFNIQGLELDGTLICWGEDFSFNDGSWQFNNSHPVNNPLDIKKNIYRVLLTRGREITVIYIPQGKKMEATWNLLTNLGIQQLQKI